LLSVINVLVGRWQDDAGTDYEMRLCGKSFSMWTVGLSNLSKSSQFQSSTWSVQWRGICVESAWDVRGVSMTRWQ